MRGRPAEEVLRLPVRLRGIQLGRPADLILDLDLERVLGFDVLCGDEVHRFLPLAAAELREQEIAVSSALTMLEEAELAFYRARAASLTALRGVALARDGAPLGRLRDVVLRAGGALEAVLVEDESGEVRPLVPGDGLRLTVASAA
jgi:hypothetical protein